MIYLNLEKNKLQNCLKRLFNSQSILKHYVLGSMLFSITYDYF